MEIIIANFNGASKVIKPENKDYDTLKKEVVAGIKETIENK